MTPALSKNPKKTPMTALLRRMLFTIALGAAATVHAQPLERIVFATDWLAQAEHGGYQAVAEGIYHKCGLDVAILGGPQVNGLQLLQRGSSTS
jgi:NitT/TauT family transport system substrate-binding protein